jgi:hypothetical protein
MLYSTGIVGLALLLAMLTTGLVNTCTSVTPQSRVAGIMLAFGMGGLAVDGDQLMTKLDVHWLLIWLPIAMIAAQRLRLETAATTALPTTESDP